MRQETIDILGRPMRTYLPDAPDRAYYHGERPAVLIFPGGGYEFTFVGEGEPIALRFASHGVAAFVLSYTCTDSMPSAYPNALREAFAAIRHLRTHAHELGIHPQKIFVCGFSAGGHLAACTGTLWNKAEAGQWGADGETCRPDGLLLCYPVLRSTPPCHSGSFRNFFGVKQPDEEMLRAFDMPKRVDRQTPRTFLWATASDDAVPVCGALEFAGALSEKGVPFELHVWENGRHGLCLGDQSTEPFPFCSPHPSGIWVEQALRFVYADANASEAG